MAKAQFTVEFMLIFGMAFLIFLISLALVIRFVEDYQDESVQKKLDTFGESIKKNIALAYEGGENFESELRVPEDIDGIKFTIKTDAGADAIIIYAKETNHSAVKFLAPIDGTINIGCNKLTKDGEVKITGC